MHTTSEDLVNSFLCSQGFCVNMDVASLTGAFLQDANSVLFDEKKFSSNPTSLLMMPTYFDTETVEIMKEKKVIVLDIGGTNFRSALVYFDEHENFKIKKQKDCKMPNMAEDISAQEFFDEIANEIDYLKDTSSIISLCFSYAMKMTKDHDGVCRSLAKDMKIKDIVGKNVGSSLLCSLKKAGWKDETRVFVLNDTQAALLASYHKPRYNYIAHIGFVLGTGVNVAYTQPAIQGNQDFSFPQIVVTEAGMLNKVPRSKFDDMIYEGKNIDSSYKAEQMISGKYLGEICSCALRFLAKDNVFSQKTTEALSNIKTLSTQEISSFLEKKKSKIFKTKEDEDIAFYLCDAIFDRTARVSAAMIAMAAKLCNVKTTNYDLLYVSCNGSTFEKGYMMRQRIHDYCCDILTKKNRICFDTIHKEDDIMIGSAIYSLCCSKNA